MFPFSWIFISGIVAVTNAIETRVFNGYELRTEVHGYLVKLDIQSSSDSALCSGSILSTKWILSSAHCFPQDTEIIIVQQKIKDNLRVLGKVKPSNVFKHASYIEGDKSYKNRKHDIAVIMTKKPMKFDRFAWSIGLANFPPKIGQSAIIAGYGVSELRQMLPREGTVVVSKCPHHVSDLICSFHNIRAEGGDSGGALTMKGRLVGVTSASCGGAKKEELEKCTTVYTSVAANLKWIKAHIS